MTARKDAPIYRARLKGYDWESLLLSYFDQTNIHFFQIKIKHGPQPPPPFAIDLYLAETTQEITNDVQLVKDNLGIQFDMLVLFHGRKLPIGMRKHGVCVKSLNAWHSVEVEAIKPFRNSCNLPQQQLINEILARTQQVPCKKPPLHKPDTWKSYKVPTKYDKVSLTAAEWLNKRIEQNCYSKIYISPEWVCAQMHLAMGKTSKLTLISPQTENHKNGTLGKSVLKLPPYIYKESELNEFDNQSFVNEILKPLKQQVYQVFVCIFVLHLIHYQKYTHRHIYTYKTLQVVQQEKLKQLQEKIEEHKCSQPFYIKQNKNVEDPALKLFGIMNYNDNIIYHLEKVDHELKRMGSKLQKACTLMKQWQLWMNGQCNDPKKRIHIDYLTSLGQELYKLTMNIIPDLRKNKSWQHLLLLLHYVFPAEPTMQYCWKFEGEFIPEDCEFETPICVLQAIHNVMYAYHLLLSWYSLHYTSRHFWKNWCEWIWMSDTLTYFISFVRDCIKARIDGKFGTKNKKSSYE